MSSAKATLISKEQFDECIKYMRKAKDLGRTPTPIWVIGLIILLGLAAGWGISTLLGGWMIPGAKDSLQHAIGYMVAFITSVFSFIAGRAYYRTSLLRRCYKEFKNNGGNHSTQSISLNDPQNIDDNEPAYAQTVNRVAERADDKGSYRIFILAIIVIALMATSLTYVRELTLERRELIYQITHDNANDIIIEGGSPVGFQMLSLVFVITQIVSMWAGYKYGFAGRESSGAYAATGGVADYDGYCRLRNR